MNEFLSTSTVKVSFTPTSTLSTFIPAFAKIVDIRDKFWIPKNLCHGKGKGRRS